MPLIDSPRLTARDREHWQSLTRYDRAIAGSGRLDLPTERALDVLEAYGPDDVYVSISWGKDSTVLADLVARSGLAGLVPLVWVRTTPWDNPDCPAVRDAFLELHPHMRDSYHEIVTDSWSRRWWQDADGWTAAERSTKTGFALAAQRFGARHISGIRGEESRVRRIAQARWGDSSVRACRPIGSWHATDVFAYLHLRELPVHPAYAMTAGGQYDRRWLRVSAIGGARGADKGRADWELAYYGDIVGPDAPLRRAHP